MCLCNKRNIAINVWFITVMTIGILVLTNARTKLPNGDTILLWYDGNKGHIGIVLVVCFASLPIIIWLCWRLIKNDTDSIETEVPEGGIRYSASSVNHQTAFHHENIHGPSVNINMTLPSSQNSESCKQSDPPAPVGTALGDMQ